MTDIVNPRQAGIITSISILANKLILLPSLIFWQAKDQAIFVIVLLLAFEFLIMYFILKLKQKMYPLSLNDILKLTLGKVITKIIYVFFLLILFAKFIYVFLESYNYLKEMVNEDATLFLFILCALPIASSLAYMGLKSFGRTAQFFFWFIIFGLICCISVSFLVEVNLSPVVEPGFQFLPKSFNYIFWFSDYLFLLLFYDKVTPQKNYGNIILKYVLITSVLLIVFYFIYYSLFTYTPFLHYFAISDIVQFNVFLGDVWKLDIVALLTIMFLLYFELGFLMYASCECLNKIFVPMKKYISIVIVNFFVFVYIYLAILNLDFIIESAIGYLKYIVMFCGFVIPIILLIVYFYNRKKLRGKYAKFNKKFNS